MVWELDKYPNFRVIQKWVNDFFGKAAKQTKEATE
jgi:hypothetical protein